MHKKQLLKSNNTRKGDISVMDILKATFKNVDTAACIIYSAMTQSAPIVGTLTTGMCGGIFYCDINAKDSLNRPAGHKGFYKLYMPERYGLNITEGFVLIKGNPSISTTGIIDESIIDASSRTVMMRSSPMILSAATPPTEARALSVTNANEPTSNSITPNRTIYSIAEDLDGTSMTKLSLLEDSLNLPTTKQAYEKMKNDMLVSFNKHNMPIVGSKLTKAFPRIFFTRPDLNFFGDSPFASNTSEPIMNKLHGKIAADSWYQQLYNTDPYLMSTLTSSYTRNHDFNPFLSNAAQSFDLSDEKLETLEHGETFTGWKVKYGKHTNGTKTAGSFSIAYNETNRIEVYKIHKAWVDYISKVYRGEVDARETNIKDMVLDYACSVYYFLCAEDGETVLFWSKYVGVFPTSIPAGQFAWSKENIVKMPENTVEYDYAWKDDMDPASLADFNYNSKLTSYTNLPTHSSLYNPHILGPGYAFAGRPFLDIRKNSDGKYVIKLRYANL